MILTFSVCRVTTADSSTSSRRQDRKGERERRSLEKLSEATVLDDFVLLNESGRRNEYVRIGQPERVACHGSYGDTCWLVDANTDKKRTSDCGHP